MPKMTAYVDDQDGTTIIVPGVQAYATVVTTVYDTEGNKVEERRLYFAEGSFGALPGGQNVNLKGKRNSKPTGDTAETASEGTETPDTETVTEDAPTGRRR